jgi:hypothetical protein
MDIYVYLICIAGFAILSFLIIVDIKIFGLEPRKWLLVIWALGAVYAFLSGPHHIYYPEGPDDLEEPPMLGR